MQLYFQDYLTTTKEDEQNCRLQFSIILFSSIIELMVNIEWLQGNADGIFYQTTWSILTLSYLKNYQVVVVIIYSTDFALLLLRDVHIYNELYHICSTR